jgi:DNA repair protein RecN (Recombination protein N)
MLCSLRIKNLALVEAVTLEFSEGFTVITGETGAGKSVLLGALSLLAGNRTGKTVVRKGAEQCEVEGVLQFDDTSAVNDVLSGMGLPLCEDGQLILRRLVSATKAGRVYINGAAATLAQLEQLGQSWIDFHGPGEPQKLFHERYQLEMLDVFAGAEHQKKLVAYRERYSAWREALREVENISSQEKMSEDEIAFTQSQLDRLAKIDLSEEGVVALERDFKRLSSRQELGELLSRMDNVLGTEEGVGAQIPLALRIAREVAAIDADAESLESRLNALAIELADIQGEYGQLADKYSGDDSDSLETVTERMNLWLEFRRKYGPSLEAVRAKRDALARRLALQGDIAGALARAGAYAAGIEQELLRMAGGLREARVAVAGKLAAAAKKMLAKLGFKKADLRIRIADTDRLSDTGNSFCEYLFLPNAGQDLLPLNKIASSGETARVMLALKTVLVGVDKTPVLVFDEVDANVGGEIGVEVGRELAALAGRRHQVFCVTHLPQVAAQGRQHFEVIKSQTKDATTVTIQSIHDNIPAREGELARMLGDRRSASALTHARELLAK